MAGEAIFPSDPSLRGARPALHPTRFMLLKLPDILSPSELQLSRQWLHHAAWSDGADSAGAQARAVKNNQQLAHDSEAAAAIRTQVLNGLNQSAVFFSAALPLRIFTPRVNRYSEHHNTYGPHIDNAIRLKPTNHGQTEAVRTDLSCTVFLNDPDEYDGGELTIHDTYGSHAIKLPAGHAVLYPGNSLHEVTPVTRGQRLACFFWVQSMVRSNEHRRLLFELDMNLLKLRGQHGESPETTALTGTYHNLLRMWTEV